jgi:hypothetical protein
MAKSTTASGKTPAATGASGKAPAAKDTTIPRGWDTAPRTMRHAVRLMLAGAVATFIWGVYQVVVTAGFKSALADYYVKVDHITKAKAISDASHVSLFPIVLQVVVAAALWVLVARFCRDGRGWARIAATVLFLIWSYTTYGTFTQLSGSWIGPGNLIIDLVIWGIGCAALASLWRADSSAYFKPAAPAAAKAPAASKPGAGSKPASGSKPRPAAKNGRLPARTRGPGNGSATWPHQP